MSKQFCIVPEGSVFIQTTGVISPCCLLSSKYDSVGHLDHYTLSSAFYGTSYTIFRENHRQNKLTAGCEKNCVSQKNNVIHKKDRSKRIANFKEQTNLDLPKIVVADLSFGNVCNLSCTFCGPEFSSSWAKILNDQSSSNWPIYNFSKEKLMSMADDLVDAKFVSLKGGEPFNIPNLDEFLYKLADINPTVQLDFLTNGTEISDKHLKALEQFNDFSFTISTEATGTLYQYLRGGKYKWEDILTNIKNLKSIGCNNMHIASILLLYNYKHWAKDMLEIQESLDALKFSNSTIVVQLCKGPPEQSIFTLKNSVREQIVEDIKSHIAQGLNVYDINGIYELLVNDIPAKTTKNEIFEKVKFFNNIRSMDLFSIIDDFTEDLAVE